MAKTNLNFYNNLTANQANLTRKLIDEAIETYGIQCYYLPRTTPNLDRLLGDDPTSTFDSAYELTMLPTSPENFNSGEQIMSNFGFISNYTYTLFIEMQRFTNMTGMEQPSEDDLIYIELFQKWFKIKSSNNKDQFYYQGQLYCYKLEIAELKYSHEPVSTGETVVDNNLPVSQDEINTDADAIDTEDIRDNLIEGMDDLINEE